ncbi:MAG: aminotransferase class I/II-fold pyridoxal phosphate-dependent enzyme [Bacteroidia bacterium]
MKYKRMPIEIESPEQLGYETIECNLAESSVHDAIFKNLNLNLDELILCYGDHIGKPELRQLIAQEYDNILANDVLLTAGAAAALFIVATSLLQKEDHLIVIRPNYATNIETPRSIGCEIDFIDLQFENNFQIDINAVKKLIKNTTKYISITTPHNPTGTIIDEKTLLELIKLAETNNIYLLVDETYRDLSPEKQLPLAATLSENAISVSSVSKAFGLPGIRIGWLITRNKKLQELFLAAKEQIFLCNSVLDEEIAYQFLLKKHEFLPEIQEKIIKNRLILKNWMKNHPFLEWIEPQAAVVCFPRIKSEKEIDIEQFYNKLYTNHKTLVGAGHWFEMDKRYMRIGYGWPNSETLIKGLNNITKALKESLK